MLLIDRYGYQADYTTCESVQWESRDSGGDVIVRASNRDIVYISILHKLSVLHRVVTYDHRLKHNAFVRLWVLHSISAYLDSVSVLESNVVVDSDTASEREKSYQRILRLSKNTAIK